MKFFIIEHKIFFTKNFKKRMKIKKRKDKI